MSFAVGDICEFTDKVLAKEYGQWTIVSIDDDGRVYGWGEAAGFDTYHAHYNSSDGVHMTNLSSEKGRYGGFRLVEKGGPAIIEDWRL